MRIVALVGNGTSIVYNNELSISALTTDIVGAFSALAGSAAGDALAAFAQQVKGEEREDFEGLLGPLDAITQALPLLGGVTAPFANVPSISEPLQAATEALRSLHRLGLGTALHLIAERSHNQGETQLQLGPGALANALVDLADGDSLTIATPNYDGLLQAVLPSELVADLAIGFGDLATDLGGGTQLQSWPLRTTADFPENRSIHLLHLHGSLGWLRTSIGMRKFQIEHLRAADAWQRIVNGDLNADPVVVLTDRKENVPGTAPFALGYKVFSARLFACDHWCIAGYGLLDVPVNQALTDAARARQDAGLAEPDVLILGRGDPGQLETLFKERVGDITPRLFVDGSGVPTSIGSAQWQAWMSA